MIPSSSSRLPASKSPLTPPTLSESLHAPPRDIDTSLTLQAVPQDTAKFEEHPVPPSADASVSSPFSDSDGLGSQTRANIRAWAKATRPGPPSRDTPSPVDSSILMQSSFAHALDPFPSALSPASSHSNDDSIPAPAADSRSGSEDYHNHGHCGRSIGSGNALLEHSSSNNADVESTGSASRAGAPLSCPPRTHPARARPLPSPHGQSSMSSTPSRAIVTPYVHAYDQIERRDRRQHRNHQSHSHPHLHSTPRRHRDHDHHRERDRRSHTSPSQGPEPLLRPLQLMTGGGRPTRGDLADAGALAGAVDRAASEDAAEEGERRAGRYMLDSPPVEAVRVFGLQGVGQL